MTLPDILWTIIIQTLFCLGFRTLLSEGMILHFIRKPFEIGKYGMLNIFKNKCNAEKYIRIGNNINFILKPILICVICFSSFWGGLVFLFLNGFKWEILICCISTAFVIRFINDKMDW